jgi:hypothetical protein
MKDAPTADDRVSPLDKVVQAASGVNEAHAANCSNHLGIWPNDYSQGRWRLPMPPPYSLSELSVRDNNDRVPRQHRVPTTLTVLVTDAAAFIGMQSAKALLDGVQGSVELRFQWGHDQKAQYPGRIGILRTGTDQARRYTGRPRRRRHFHAGKRTGYTGIRAFPDLAPLPSGAV